MKTIIVIGGRNHSKRYAELIKAEIALRNHSKRYAELVKAEIAGEISVLNCQIQPDRYNTLPADEILRHTVVGADISKYVFGNIKEDYKIFSQASILGEPIKGFAKAYVNHLNEIHVDQSFEAMQAEAMINLSRSFNKAQMATETLREMMTKLAPPKHTQQKKQGWRRPYKYHK